MDGSTLGSELIIPDYGRILSDLYLKDKVTGIIVPEVIGQHQQRKAHVDYMHELNVSGWFEPLSPGKMRAFWWIFHEVSSMQHMGAVAVFHGCATADPKLIEGIRSYLRRNASNIREMSVHELLRSTLSITKHIPTGTGAGVRYFGGKLQRLCLTLAFASARSLSDLHSIVYTARISFIATAVMLKNGVVVAYSKGSEPKEWDSKYDLPDMDISDGDTSMTIQAMISQIFKAKNNCPVHTAFPTSSFVVKSFNGADTAQKSSNMTFFVQVTNNTREVPLLRGEVLAGIRPGTAIIIYRHGYPQITADKVAKALSYVGPFTKRIYFINRFMYRKSIKDGVVPNVMISVDYANPCSHAEYDEMAAKHDSVVANLRDTPTNRWAEYHHDGYMWPDYAMLRVTTQYWSPDIANDISIVMPVLYKPPGRVSIPDADDLYYARLVHCATLKNTEYSTGRYIRDNNIQHLYPAKWNDEMGNEMYEDYRDEFINKKKGDLFEISGHFLTYLLIYQNNSPYMVGIKLWTDANFRTTNVVNSKSLISANMGPDKQGPWHVHAHIMATLSYCFRTGLLPVERLRWVAKTIKPEVPRVGHTGV